MDSYPKRSRRGRANRNKVPVAYPGDRRQPIKPDVGEISAFRRALLNNIVEGAVGYITLPTSLMVSLCQLGCAATTTASTTTTTTTLFSRSKEKQTYRRNNSRHTLAQTLHSPYVPIRIGVPKRSSPREPSAPSSPLRWQCGDVYRSDGATAS